MKVTIYTISDCPYSKEEKDYLTAKGVQYEEKDVSNNKDNLSEMLDLSNKFAGVPFSVVEKDSGEKVMLKGFTKVDFDNVIDGVSGAPEQPAPDAVSAPLPSVDGSKPVEPVTETPQMLTGIPGLDAMQGMPASPQPVAPVDPMAMPATPAMSGMPSMPSEPAIPTMPAAPTISAPVAPAPVVSAPAAPAPVVAAPVAPTMTPSVSASQEPQDPQDPQDALSGLLKDLESKVTASQGVSSAPQGGTPAPVAPVAPAQPLQGTMPSVPDFTQSQ